MNRQLYTQEEVSKLFGLGTSYISKICKKLNIQLLPYDKIYCYNQHDIKRIEQHLSNNRQGKLKAIHYYIMHESDRLQCDYIVPLKTLKESYELNTYDLYTILADITEIDDRLYEDDEGKIFYATAGE